MLNLLFGLLMSGPVNFKPVVSFGPLPDDSLYFLEEPLSMDIDKDGNYYVVDGGAKVVFSWDKNGVYRKTIGKPGAGPGEFVFTQRRNASAYISVVGEDLYVMDGGNQSIAVFDLEGNFKKSMPLARGRGRALNFFATEDHQFILHRRSRKNEGIVNAIELFSADIELIKTIASQADDTFKPGQRRNGGPRFTIKGYNPTLVSHYNRGTGQLLVGNGDEAFFRVIDKDGKTTKIETPLVRQEVTQADKDEFMRQFDDRARARINVTFSEKKPYFDKLISLGGSGYLVYLESPFRHEVSGIHLDKAGKAQGRFSFTCGENGSLSASNGRLVRFSLDQNDDFQIQELTLAP